VEKLCQTKKPEILLSRLKIFSIFIDGKQTNHGSISCFGKWQKEGSDTHRKTGSYLHSNVMILRILYLILLLEPFVLSAQDSTKATPWFFDDGGISKSRNTVSINPLGIYRGEYCIYWENRCTRHYSFEVGGGVLSQKYDFHFLSLLPENFRLDFKPSKPGLSVSLIQKLKNPGMLNHFSSQLGINFRGFSELIVADIFLSEGFKYFVFDRICTEINIGLGYRFQHSRDKTSGIFELNDKLQILIPISLRIGYLL